LRLAFLGGLEQQLHSETNAQHGLLQGRNQLMQVFVAQPSHGVGRGAHSGENDVAGFANLSGSADTAEGTLERSRANCSEAMFAPPFATMTTSLGSQHALGAGQFTALEAMAWRRLRPTPLKQDSIMW
jgi:hypothetical protein